MSAASPVVLDSSGEEKLIGAINRTKRGESTYEWVNASLTESDSVHIEIEFERTGTKQTELILSFVVLVDESYLNTEIGAPPPEALSDASPQLEELEATLEGILSRVLGHQYTLYFERSDSYNGEDTAYVASLVFSG